MIQFSRLKTALIGLACLIGLLLCVPNVLPAPAAWMPWRHVRLGLDLRGGSYLLMRLDTEALTQARLQATADAARQILRDPALGGWRDWRLDPLARQVRVRLRDPARRGAIQAALGKIEECDVTVTPGGEAILTLSPAALKARLAGALAQSIEIVRRRIDETGVVDPEIAPSGEDRLVVQLPGVEDPNRIKALIGKTAHMTFQMADDAADPAAPPPDDVTLPMATPPGPRLVVRRRVEVDGADLTNASAGQNPQTGEWVVNFAFDGLGTERFAEASAAGVGKRFAIVLDGRVVSAPVIREPITGGRGQISGAFTAQAATDLAVLLRAGALPAPLTVIEERSIGPALGAASIRAGAISLGVGFGLVIVFMALFYGLFGWFANAALVVNLVMQLAALSVMGATLTLPGMAGILLTLGMAVDANILINERIREEARAGRKPVAAMEAGFRRAYATILDSQMATFLAHVMLFVFGAGPVRGFAVTITVGILTTLFSAILVARLLMARWYAAARPATLPV